MYTIYSHGFYGLSTINLCIFHFVYKILDHYSYIHHNISMKLYKVESVGLVDKVYENIKTMILNRELVPGQKLVQEEMAERLGVSRTPILSAFSKLEKEWLVKSIPRRGYYIYEMSREEKLNLFDIRLRLEPLGAKRAAEVGSKDQKLELIEFAESGREIIESQDFVAFNKHDYEFHKKIMVMSSNTMLDMMLSSFNIIGLSNQNASDINYESSINGHIELAKTILNGDGIEAEEVMLKHLQRGFSYVKVGMADE